MCPYTASWTRIGGCPTPSPPTHAHERQINGVYAHQEGSFGDRPTFQNKRTGLHLYYHPGRKAWAIGDRVGSVSPYAFVGDNARTPDQVQGLWMVFNRERSYHASAGPQGRGGRFEQDLNVACRPVEGLAPAPPLRRLQQGQLWFDRERHQLL